MRTPRPGDSPRGEGERALGGPPSRSLSQAHHTATQPQCWLPGGTPEGGVGGDSGSPGQRWGPTFRLCGSDKPCPPPVGPFRLSARPKPQHPSRPGPGPPAAAQPSARPQPLGPRAGPARGQASDAVGAPGQSGARPKVAARKAPSAGCSPPTLSRGGPAGVLSRGAPSGPRPPSAGRAAAQPPRSTSGRIRAQAARPQMPLRNRWPAAAEPPPPAGSVPPPEPAPPGARPEPPPPAAPPRAPRTSSSAAAGGRAPSPAAAAPPLRPRAWSRRPARRRPCRVPAPRPAARPLPARCPRPPDGRGPRVERAGGAPPPTRGETSHFPHLADEKTEARNG